MANQLTAKIGMNEQADMGTALDALKGTLSQTKLAKQNFGPNDSMIGSAVRHPIMAFDKALEWLQTQVGNAAGLPQQQDEAIMYQYGALPQAQAQGALNLAGTAQLGSMPMAPMSRGGTLGSGPIIAGGQRTDVMVGQPANSFINGVPTSGRDIPFNVPTQDVRMREYVRGKYKPEGMFNEPDANKLDFLKGYRGNK
jgi:hypothetical protein